MTPTSSSAEPDKTNGVTIGRSVRLLVFSRVFSALCQAAIIFLLSAVSKPEDLVFALSCFSVALVVAGVTDFGMTTLILVNTQRDKKRAKEILGADTVLTAIICTIAVFVALGSLVLFGDSIGVEKIFVALSLILWALVETLTEAGSMLQLGEGFSGKAAFTIALRRALGLLLFGVLLIFAPPAMAFSVGLLLGTTIAYFWVPKVWGDLKIFSKSFFEELRPFAVMNIFGQLRNLEVPIISGLVSASQSAAFAFGTRVSAPVLILGGSAGNAVLAGGVTHLQRRIKFVATLSFVVIAGLLIFGELIATFLSPISQRFVSWLDGPALMLCLLVLVRTVVLSLAGIFSAMLIGLGFETYISKFSFLFSSLALVTTSVIAFALRELNTVLVAGIVLALIQVVVLLAKASKVQRENVGLLRQEQLS